MKELKPFDLEAAKRGEPICLYNGDLFHFVGVCLGGTVVVQYMKGTALQERTPDQLRMAPKKRTVYVNIYPDRTAYWDYEPMIGAENAIAIAIPVEIEE